MNDSLRTRAVGLAGFTGLTATFAATIFTSSFHGPLAVRIAAFSMLIGALIWSRDRCRSPYWGHSS